MKTTQQIEKLEEAQSIILEVAKEYEGLGESKFLRDIASRLSEQIESLRECSICQSKTEVMPKAGSGVETHWICKKCVLERGIEVLPEYLENIEEFGHWHRPLGGKN
jgi:hypothetical protein